MILIHQAIIRRIRNRILHGLGRTFSALIKFNYDRCCSCVSATLLTVDAPRVPPAENWQLTKFLSSQRCQASSIELCAIFFFFLYDRYKYENLKFLIHCLKFVGNSSFHSWIFLLMTKMSYFGSFKFLSLRPFIF